MTAEDSFFLLAGGRNKFRRQLPDCGNSCNCGNDCPRYEQSTGRSFLLAGGDILLYTYTYSIPRSVIITRWYFIPASLINLTIYPHNLIWLIFLLTCVMSSGLQLTTASSATLADRTDGSSSEILSKYGMIGSVAALNGRVSFIPEGVQLVSESEIQGIGSGLHGAILVRCVDWEGRTVKRRGDALIIFYFTWHHTWYKDHRWHPRPVPSLERQLDYLFSDLTHSCRSDRQWRVATKNVVEMCHVQ